MSMAMQSWPSCLLFQCKFLVLGVGVRGREAGAALGERAGGEGELHGGEAGGGGAFPGLGSCLAAGGEGAELFGVGVDVGEGNLGGVRGARRGEGESVVAEEETAVREVGVEAHGEGAAVAEPSAADVNCGGGVGEGAVEGVGRVDGRGGEGGGWAAEGERLVKVVDEEVEDGTAALCGVSEPGGPAGEAGDAGEAELVQCAVAVVADGVSEVHVCGKEADDVGDHESGAAAGGGGDDAAAVREIECEGLFAEDVLAGFEGGDGDFGMKRGGEADVDGIDFRVAKEGEVEGFAGGEGSASVSGRGAGDGGEAGQGGEGGEMLLPHHA